MWLPFFLHTVKLPHFSDSSRSTVTMVCHRAVQRKDTKGQTHGTPFKGDTAMTKHIKYLSPSPKFILTWGDPPSGWHRITNLPCITNSSQPIRGKE